MKKFLSLLLALTMVLSLVIVPARATDLTGTIDGTLSVKKGGNPISSLDLKVGDAAVTLTATLSEGAKLMLGNNEATVSGTPSYAWTVPTGSDVVRVDNGSVTVLKAGTATVRCTATLSGTISTKDDGEASATDKNISGSTYTDIEVTVTDPAAAANAAFQTAAAAALTFKYNTRTYIPDSNGKVTAYKYSDEAADTWEVTGTDGLSAAYNNVSSASTSGNKVTVTAMTKVPEGSSSSSVRVKAEFTLEAKTASFGIKRTPTTGNIIAGGKLALATENAVLPNGLSYEWKYTKSGESSATSISNTTSSFEWTVPASLAGAYTVSCTAKSDDTVVATATKSLSIEVIADQWGLFPANSSSLNTIYLTSNQSKDLPTDIMLYAKGADGKKTGEPLSTGVTYDWTCSNSLEIRDGKVSAKTGASGSYTVTRTAVYQNKEYRQNITVVVSSLTATWGSSVENGSYTDLYKTTLADIAQRAIREQVSGKSSVTVSSTGVTLARASATRGTLNAYTSYYRYNAPSTYIGKDVLTLTATASDHNTYTITLNVSVKPITTTYADQYPEPVASGNTYRYYVQVPSGARYYYVAGVNNEPSDWNNGSGNKYYTTTSSTSLYSLTDSNFTNGKCTLYIVTQGTDYKLYCGTITVYQKNYNINYNGVTGETVQFAQSDFTDFMNEVAEARGDASKTKSYPYVTFDYVTFSLPTTAQGTLYYGGTAMSTSNSSGAFNTRTKVTNLDSVTFVPNAKTTAKTITLNFTLYATRYSSSSTSHGTTVPYSGSVVVNLVREDIKYTVSQGDSVRFDESDFLSYLRSTKGYTSNYTIDYVTFDQSAVSAVNEGSLYTYYNGYNYGGSVKTTDKFYYSATASQNALSDVAFLASRYAKTGETVYIPFTIYARYGTTGTGTRQLTGTVAIKIGQTMNFIDVKTTDYFYDSVKWAVNKGVTTGTSSTTFSPYNPCKRAEIVTFLWRAAGSPEPTITRNPFRDVNAVTHSSYYKAILWASQKGIAAGTSTTTFSPDQVCTRAQIVTFLYRYAGKPSGYYSNPFKDVSATNEASYYNAILWASGKGITTGSSPTTFSPYASCNRAEAVTFLYRYTNGL